ncbi:hypothetical protein [Nonomuraea africana]|uniref:hypothetical protein n=1 Tax=Nonomuraea africana TaxID=46171 RepID=UPI0033E7F1D2
MGSFDGMDPTLVRDLLAEVRRAAVQMRSLESRVAQATRAAGLATPATHRPSQVADACEEMARDVTGRLALLEKKEAAPRVGEQAKDLSPNGTPASGEKDPAPEDSREEDRASKTTTPPASSDPAPRKDPTPPEPESKKDPAPPEPESKKDPAPAEPESKKDPEPVPKSESTPRDVPAEPESKKDPEPAPADQPKDDDRDSRHDRGTGPDTSGQDILDTPKKDHPDDIDQTDAGKPQVVEVDGVKVLQIPLDPPTAREIADLLDDVDEVRPTDLPSVEGSAAPLTSTDAPSERPATPLSPAVAPSEGSGTPLTPAVAPPEGSGNPLAPTAAPPEGTAGGEGPAERSDGIASGRGSVAGTEQEGDVVAGWANDGSDVVSVDARAPSDAALRTLVESASEIEPMEMPGVEVPPGEWGKGEWVPKDFGPDGEPGRVEPGAPDRPTVPPGS